MSQPTYVTDDLIDLITRHQIIDAEPLWQYLASRGGAVSLPEDASEVVADLVRERLLSDYQGDQLLAGNVAGLIVGKYQLLDRIGDLGSSVFLARLRRSSQATPTGSRSSQHVALKLLTRETGIPSSVVERFRREAEALARLDHPGIVGIKDSGEDNGRLYLVMEYIDGESLGELVQRQGPLPPALAVRSIHAALDALAHIHQAGLIHRNLEPGHILLDRQQQVRIVDLGMARFLDDPTANLTMLGGRSQFLGTVEYQSPEQLLNSHDVDIRTDIYALGAILYYLLTGKEPFSQHALLRLAAGVTTHPQPLAQLRPDLPRELVGVIETMMACDRATRYATPQQASKELEGWLNVISPPPMKVARRTSATIPVVRPSSLMPPTAKGIEPKKPMADRWRTGWPTWVLAGLVFMATMAMALAVYTLTRVQ